MIQFLCYYGSEWFDVDAEAEIYQRVFGLCDSDVYILLDGTAFGWCGKIYVIALVFGDKHNLLNVTLLKLLIDFDIFSLNQ